MSKEEKISYIIESSEKRAKINNIKDYLIEEVNIESFPLEKKLQKRNSKPNERKNEINKNIKKDELEECNSEDTKITIKDSCHLLNELDENIKEFRKNNKNIYEKETNENTKLKR